jgi:hypothetical protein
LSRLGIGTRQFYELCPAEFFYALQDHQERERIILEEQIRATWESTRTQIWYDIGLNGNIKKGKRPKKVTDVFGLVWDRKEKKQQVQSVEEMKQILTQMHQSNKMKMERQQKIKNRHKIQ